MPARVSWSGPTIEGVIDRELGLNPELRRGTAAYVALIQAYQGGGDLAALREGVFEHAAQLYRSANGNRAALVTFNDGAADFLFDRLVERTVLVWGISRTVPANTRDDAYHAGYPTAGRDLDKGHAWSHAQGGREGGPNYFRQARRLNQSRSDNGRLWRGVETYLAANAGVPAFVRLAYAPGTTTDQPEQVEYGVLPRSGQFRAVIFPNA